MGGMAAARMADEIGHVGVWARLARVALRVGSAMVEGLLVAGVVALALGVSVATFGCGAFILCGLAAGFIGGATGWSDYKEKKIQEMTEDIGDLEITGTLGIKGAARVLINKRQAMRAVLDAAVCGKHASLNPNRIAEGSDSVFIETGPAARKGDKMECAAQIATGSDTVLIGGNKTQYLEIADDKMWWETGAELGLALLGRGSLPGKLGCLALGAAVGMAGDLLGKGFRSVIGYPVNPATGGKVLDGNQDTDFTLPGLLPIQWKRFYSSHDHRDHTWHGKGWSTPYEVELHVFEPEGGKPGGLTYVNPQGRCIDMPWLEPGTMFFNTAEGFTLGCTHGGAYEVVDMDLLRYQFGAPVSGFAGPGGASVLRLQRLRNRTGQWIRLSYREDADQRLDKITDPLGRIIRVQYATGALSSHSRRVQGLMLERGAVGETTGLLAQYGYDAAGQLNEVRWRDGRTARRFQYEHGLMVAHSDAANFTCFYAWQAPEAADGPVSQGLAPNSIWATPTGRDRRVVRHWTSDGEQYDIAYQVGQTLGAASTPAAPDLAGSVAGQTWATDKLGRTEHWRWNGLYNLCSYTNAMEHTWVLTWSASRELLSATLPGGQTWLWQYDDNGLPILETDPLGRSTRTLWDTNWFEPLSVSLPDDSKWRYEYDARGLCTSVTAPDGATNHYAWDNHGMLVQVTDANGGQKRLEHDPRSLLTAYTDCSGQTTRYAYDGIGHLQRVTDALGQATSLGHGVTGELLTLTLADGATQSWRYDAAGRPIAHTNAQPRTRHWTYTQRGQLQSQIDEEQRGISLAYDTAHRLTTLVNENGQHFGYQYDAADRMVEETRVGGQRVTVEYDANGWPTAVTHHPGAGDLAAGLPSGEPQNQPLRTELVRDAAGRLVEKRTTAHHYHYAYDPLDQLTQAQKLAVQADGSIKPLHTNIFVYDKVGNLLAPIQN